MRSLLLLPVALCLLATPATAVDSIDHAVQTDRMVDVQIGTSHEETLDGILDQSSAADSQLGQPGACMREAVVEDAKYIYDDEDGGGFGGATGCLGSGGQCIGLGPAPFVSYENCVDMVKDAVGVQQELVQIQQALAPGT